MVAVESGTQSGTNSQRLAYLPQRQLSGSSRWQATSVCASAPSSGSSSFRRQQRPQPSQSDSHSAAVISASDLVCQKGGFLRVGSPMGRRLALPQAPSKGRELDAHISRRSGTPLPQDQQS